MEAGRSVRQLPKREVSRPCSFLCSEPRTSCPGSGAPSGRPALPSAPLPPVPPRPPRAQRPALRASSAASWNALAYACLAQLSP